MPVPEGTATEIITLRGVTNSVVSISLNDVNSSDWTAKHCVVLSDLIDVLVSSLPSRASLHDTRLSAKGLVEPSGIEPLTS